MSPTVLARFGGVLALALGVFGCWSPAEQPVKPLKPIGLAVDRDRGGPPQPEAELSFDEAAYLSALERGRALHRRKKYEDAVKAFDAALALAPDDPRALAEQGWSAFFAGELALAERTERKAIALTQDARLKAAAHYNLGRVHEQRRDPEAAVTEYQESLRLRPDPRVERRIRNAGALVTRQHVGPTLRMTSGPHKSFSAFCKSRQQGWPEQAPDCVYEYAARGTLRSATVRTPKSGELPPAVSKVRFLVTVESESVRYHGAVKTDRGWFVIQDIAREHADQGESEKPTALKAAVVPLDPPLLQFDVEVRARDRGISGDEHVDERGHGVYICGFGTSGYPSCTGELPLAGRVDRRVGKRVLDKVAWDVQLDYPGSSAIELSGDPSSMGVRADGILGHHDLVWL